MLMTALWQFWSQIFIDSFHQVPCIEVESLQGFWWDLCREQHGAMIREIWEIEVNIIAVTLKYDRKDLRYRTGKTRSYTSKRKDTKVTNKNSANDRTTSKN